MGKKKFLPKLYLSLPNNMNPYKYFSDYYLKNAGTKQKFGYARKCAISTINFYFKSCCLHNS